jgi:CubicO group peptidase (beta-lactamase class C family)
MPNPSGDRAASQQCVAPAFTLRCLLLSVLLVLSPCIAGAEPTRNQSGEPALSPIDRFVTGFMAAHRVPGGAIAVTNGGRLVYAASYGTGLGPSPRPFDVDAPVRLASLTKSITASAIMALISDDRLVLETRLRDLGAVMAPLGRPADARILDITIRQLLTHSAGLPSRGVSDPIGWTRARAFAQGTPTRDSVLRDAMREQLLFVPGGGYAYSNVGYLLLGRIVETVSGMSYLDYVRRQVMAPIGIAPIALDAEYPYLEAAGGLTMSVVQYARFLAALSPDAEPSFLPPALRRAIVEDERVRIGSGPAFYGYGVVTRRVSTGRNVFHYGQWTDTLTFFVQSGLGRSWVIAFNKSFGQDDPALLELDKGLWAAILAVREWPAGDGFPAHGLPP